MAHNDDKPDAGDDPWAGLEAEGMPDLGGDFSFSLDGEPAAAEPESQAAPPPEAGDPLVEAFTAGDDIADDGQPADDAAIDDWLNGPADEGVGSMTPHSLADGSVEHGDVIDFGADQSSVDIGTGMSGILPGGSDESADAAEDGTAADPFAVGPGGDEGEPEEGVFAGLGGDGAVADPVGPPVVPGGKGKKRPTAGRRKKKPSVIGQLIGVVLGGALAFPIAEAIALWGFGKDAFNVAPMVPDSLAFLVPAKFRSSKRPDAIDVAAGAPSLDQILGRPGDAGNESPRPPAAADGLPADTGQDSVATPVSPDPSDLVVTDAPAPVGDDPLLNLLDQETPQPPAAPPEPEPLDLTELDAAVAAARSALQAVVAVDDPADPVRRKLLVKWYRSLAKCAQELVALESEATETGRPFGPAAERAAAIRGDLADHPQLLEAVGSLSRDWITYAKRPSDGLVTTAEFVSARRSGPYWRSQVMLSATDTRPALEMVVLTRQEPAVAPGDRVVVTGLAVDDDVVWAVDVRAAAASPFPGL